MALTADTLDMLGQHDEKLLNSGGIHSITVDFARAQVCWRACDIS